MVWTCDEEIKTVKMVMKINVEEKIRRGRVKKEMIGYD
jgi:hypothetical protein